MASPKDAQTRCRNNARNYTSAQSQETGQPVYIYPSGLPTKLRPEAMKLWPSQVVGATTIAKRNSQTTQYAMILTDSKIEPVVVTATITTTTTLHPETNNKKHPSKVE